jgi:hypothetical protein
MIVFASVIWYKFYIIYKFPINLDIEIVINTMELFFLYKSSSQQVNIMCTLALYTDIYFYINYYIYLTFMSN